MVDFPKTLFNADELMNVSLGFRNAVGGITTDVTVQMIIGAVVKDEADLKDAKSKGLSSKYTEVIQALEENCDGAYCTFRTMAKTLADQTEDMVIAEASKAVVTILRNVDWNLHKLGYKKQLSALAVLDKKLSTDEAVKALENAGLKSWYDKLTAATAKLREVADKRVGEVNDNDLPIVKVAQDQLFNHLLKLYNHIDIQEELIPDVYMPVASAMNAVLNTVTPEARQRKAKKAIAKPTNQQTATTTA
jgi:hypothetical protein